jgi:hypothetical protein
VGIIDHNTTVPGSSSKEARYGINCAELSFNPTEWKLAEALGTLFIPAWATRKKGYA